MTDDTEHRLIALEIRLSHFERMAEEMSDVMAQQARQIDLLTAQIQRLRDRMGEMANDWGGSPQDDKPPPHY